MGLHIAIGIAQLGLGMASLGEQKKAAQSAAKAQDINRRSTIRAANREAQIKSAQMRAFAGAQGISSGTYSPNPLTTQFGQQAGTTSAIGLNQRAAGLHTSNANMFSGLSEMMGVIKKMFPEESSLDTTKTKTKSKGRGSYAPLHPGGIK